jgi:hypothetical protein
MSRGVEDGLVVAQVAGYGEQVDHPLMATKRFKDPIEPMMLSIPPILSRAKLPLPTNSDTVSAGTSRA